MEATEEATVRNDKFRKMLGDLGLEDMPFPNYLRDLLIYNGFDNVYSLAYFEENDILKLEGFARVELSNLLNDNEKKDFFGIFVTNTSVFKIVEGHKKLLHILTTKCKSKLNETSKETAIKTKNKRKSDDTGRDTGNVSKQQKKIRENKTSEENSEENNEKTEEKSQQFSIENKESATEHIKSIVKKYQTNFLKSLNNEKLKNDSLAELDKLKVNVEENYALISCTKCSFVSKAYLQTDNKKQKWVLSNVNRHYKTHFKIKNKPLQTAEQQKGLQNTSIMQYFTLATPNSELPDTSEGRGERLLSLDEVVLLASAEASPSDPLISGQGENDTIIQVDSEVLDFVPGRAAEEASSRSSSSACNQMTTPQNTFSRTPSRNDRKIKSRQLTFDSYQSKLTDFYKLYTAVENAVCNNPTVQKEFMSSINILNESSSQECEKVTSPVGFLKMLKHAALKNAGKDVKSKCGNRFSEEYKKFCLYIFITSGRLAYETIFANTSNALPSIPTLQRTLSTFGKLSEGEIQFENLKEYLDKRNYPSHVFISEDQTAIVGRVRYDAATNQLVGCVPMISEKTGFPKSDQFVVNSVFDIKNTLENNRVAIYAYVYMAQPLVDGAPAFCIAIFGSDNRFSAEEVLHRWNFIDEEASKNGIKVEGFSSDGDTRCLKAMKTLAGLPSLSKKQEPYDPYFQAKFTINKPIVVQDTVHISTKIKTRILKPNIHLPMGKYTVSKEHLDSIIKDFPKDKHFLCPSYLDSSDKMNFQAIDKLCSPCVTNLLADKDHFKATQRILIITRYILDCFLDKSLTIERRVYLIWYSTFFLRLWRAWIIEHKTYTLGKNWLTLNAYTCVELNAHALILMIERCRETNNPEIFLPWLYSSQPCEKFFRQTRSMTSTYATKVNFDMLDLLQRKHRIQTINCIVSDSGQFIFPRERNVKLGDNLGDNRNKTATIIPSVNDIKNIIEEAKLDAIDHARSLEMILPINLEKRAVEVVSLSSISNPEEDNDSEEKMEADRKEINSEQTETQTDMINTEDLGEDIQDIAEELEIFKDLEDLNIKDVTEKHRNSKTTNKAYLNVIVNNKTMNVKKQTLCWLFSNKTGRLSTDRIIRVRGMQQSKQRQEQRQQQIYRQKSKKSSDQTSDQTEDETSTSDGSYVSQSDFEDDSLNESFSEGEALPTQRKSVNIEIEKYFAVLYDTWYIGRIVELVDDDTCKVKFLKSELDTYIWPKSEDIQFVKHQYIFYGPVHLNGTGPFTLRRSEKVAIEKIFKQLKC